MTVNKYNSLSILLKGLFAFESIILIVTCLLLNNFEINLFSLHVHKEAILNQYLIGIFVVIVQFSFIALGLYNTKYRESFKGIFSRIIASVSFGVIALVITSGFMNNSNLDMSYMTSLLFVTVTFFSGLRLLMLKVDLFSLKKKTILIIGAGTKAKYFETRMKRVVDRQNFTIHGFIPTDGDNLKKGITKETIINIEQTGLVIYALEHEIDEIVVATDEPRGNLHVDELFASKIKGVDIVEMTDFIEREMHQIPTDMLTPSKVMYSDGFSSNNHLRNALDWLFNTSLAFVLLILTWPILLLTVVMIKIEDGIKAPVLYKQERVGANGRTFNIFKFRSMRIDAEKHGAKMATKNDERITKVGKFIRRVRIDELPQILNVMSGQMGFVGPRPERPIFVNKLIQKYHFFDERHNVKPGLTGWAQLMYPYGATENDSFEKLKFDLYYIKHRSFTLDILILIRTVEVVLFGKGR
jgi:sugar transferase (PEP-CTERM system associated)